MMDAGIARASEIVRVPKVRAFKLFTERFGDWYRIDEHTVFDPNRTITLKLEGYVGGHLIDVTDASTNSGNVRGTVNLWDPPHRFVYLDLNRCDVEVRFDEVQEGTQVSVEVRGLDQLEPKRASRIRKHGWHTTLAWYRDWMRNCDDGT